MKNILIVLLVLAVIVLGYLQFKPKPVIVTPIDTETTAQNTQPASIPTPITWKTYSNTQYGFSFQYPSDWKLTDDPVNKQVKIATNDIALNVEQTSYPTYSISFKTTDKTFFSKPIYTKWGGITYDENRNAILVEGKCQSPTPFGNIQHFIYGGSLMSDPAYSDAAITTTNKTIIITRSEQGGSLNKIQNDIQTVEKSFQLLNGNSVFVPLCSTSQQ